MSFKYSYTNDRFFCLFTGIVTWDDLFAATGNLYGGDKMENLREILVIFSDSSRVIVGGRVPMELAFLDKAASRLNQHLNFAFVAKAPQAKQLANKYIEFSKEFGIPWEYHVFDNYDEATKWLDFQKSKQAQKQV
jgi:hypothetical protein